MCCEQEQLASAGWPNGWIRCSRQANWTPLASALQPVVQLSTPAQAGTKPASRSSSRRAGRWPSSEIIAWIGWLAGKTKLARRPQRVARGSQRLDVSVANAQLLRRLKRDSLDHDSPRPSEPGAGSAQAEAGRKLQSRQLCWAFPNIACQVHSHGQKPANSSEATLLLNPLVEE